MESNHSESEQHGPPKQQVISNQLVESISSSLPIYQIQALLDQLDSEQIDQHHSSTRFSPLETLLSRYPNLHGNDLQLLDLPFEKGADFAGISEEVQDRMIELDYEEREMSLVVSQFETRLVRSFEEMDTAHQYIQVKEPQSETRSSSLIPLTESCTSTLNDIAQGCQDRSSTPSRPPSRAPIDSAASVQDQEETRPVESSSSLPSHRPRSSQSGSSEPLSRMPPPSSQSHQLLSPSSPSLSRPPPTPLSHTRSLHLPRSFTPSRANDLVRLYIPLPLGTHERYLIRYFHLTFEVEITNLSLWTSQSPSFGFFDVSRDVWERSELLSEERIREIERRYPLKDLEGKTWGIRLNIAREARTKDERRQKWRERGGKESGSWRNEREEREVRGLKNSSFDRNQFQRGRHNSFNSRGNPSRHIDDGWITLALSGFPQDITFCDDEDFLSQRLRYWEDLNLSFKRGGVEASSRVRGVKAAEAVEGEVRRIKFEGRRIEVEREEGETWDFYRRSSRARRRSRSSIRHRSHPARYCDDSRAHEEEGGRQVSRRTVRARNSRRSLSPGASRRSRGHGQDRLRHSDILSPRRYRSRSPSDDYSTSSFVSRDRNRSHQRPPPSSLSSDHCNTDCYSSTLASNMSASERSAYSYRRFSSSFDNRSPQIPANSPVSSSIIPPTTYSIISQQTKDRDASATRVERQGARWNREGWKRV